MIDREKKMASLKALLDNQVKRVSRDGLSTDETNELFQRMISPIKNPIDYAGIRSAFKINPMCSECFMEFENDQSRSMHTVEECVSYKVHNS
jgi:hypothetical protein